MELSCPSMSACVRQVSLFRDYTKPRMLRHRLGDALATFEAGGQELIGIRPVGRRTRRTAGLPPSAARLEQHPVRLPLGVVHLPNLTRGPVGVLDPAGQADRMVTVAGLSDQLHPALIALAGAVHDLAEDAGQQFAHDNRVGHAAPSGAGIGGTTRSPGACSASRAAGSARRPVLARTMAATWW